MYFYIKNDGDKVAGRIETTKIEEDGWVEVTEGEYLDKMQIKLTPVPSPYPEWIRNGFSYNNLNTQTVNSRQEFLEDCIAELALQAYN